MKLRIPVFIQLSILIIVFAVISSLVSLSLFKNFTIEVIEDGIFSRYLRDSENIASRLSPVLQDYELKVQSCTQNISYCDKEFIEPVDIKTVVNERKLKQVKKTPLYYSEESGSTSLYLNRNNQEFLISLLPLQNKLIDIAVQINDYLLAINKDGIVVFNLTSPFPANEKLTLDEDTLAKLNADITSGNFYLRNKETGFQSMNLYHSLPFLNLKLVIGNENKFVFYELKKVERYASKIFLFALPVILILSFIISQFQRSRFRKISTALQKFSNENFEVRIEEGNFKQLDEIDDLVSAFNLMAYELEKFHKLNVNKILSMNSKLVETNFELANAKAIADQANKAKTQFLATMSHDIRTPLNAIIGFTQIIQQSDEYSSIPNTTIEHIENIRLGGQNLTELINNILDLSKIEAGKMEINETEVNIKILLQGIYSINKSLADNKNITLQYTIDPLLPEKIEIDRTKLNQILMNLCGNAIKFTPNKKGIFIEANKSGELIEFKVRDEGIGIPKGRLEGVFEAFEQSDKTITSNFGGTGLGLSIVKKMTELLGGSISLESELNVGSCFTVKIPLKASTSIETKIIKKIKLKFETEFKILIIDDNQMNYEILRFHLKKLGLKSIYADSGRKGLDLIKEELPDLILLDIHMPGMSGIEVKKELLANPKFSHIPTVVMSADVFSESKNEALEVAFSDFVSKPIDFEELNSVLEKNLRPKTNS